jgi:hypothetical protein
MSALDQSSPAFHLLLFPFVPCFCLLTKKRETLRWNLNPCLLRLIFPPFYESGCARVSPGTKRELIDNGALTGGLTFFQATIFAPGIAANAAVSTMTTARANMTVTAATFMALTGTTLTFETSASLIFIFHVPPVFEAIWI